MRGLFFIGFALLLLVSGCSRKTTSMTTTTKVTDSTWTKTIPRLQPVKLPGKKAFAFGKIHLDSTGKFIPVRIKSSEGESYVDVSIDKEGNIKATGGYDSLRTVVEALDKEINRLRREITKETKTVTVTEYKTRSIDIFARWFCGIILGLGALVVYLKFKKVIL